MVHIQGVITATNAAATKPAAIDLLRDFSDVPASVAQHSTPINIIDSPKMFSTSTRSKSVHGESGKPSTNSWTRNNSPNPKISAPRKIVVRAIALRATPFSRSRCVAIADEIPAKKIKSGAGSVPRSCDHP